MIALCIENTMYQPVNGQRVRTVGIPEISDSDTDLAHSTPNYRVFTSKCRKARTYISGKDVSNNELCREEVELVRQSSNGERRRCSPVTFAEVPLRNGDTLVTIALKYGCRISELKQLNRLIRDQDVFGLRMIRVPVKRYGIVEELIKAEMAEEQTNIKLGTAEVSNSESSDNESMDDREADCANTMHQPLLQHTDPSDSSRLSKQGRQAVKHLHAVDSSVRTVVSAVASSRTLGSYACNRAAVYTRRQEVVPLWNRIRWWAIVIGTTFIILPLMFVLYVKFLKP